MPLNSEDRWIIASVIISLAGVATAALLRNPSVIGLSAFIVLAILLIAWRRTHSSRLAWLLLFGSVAGIGELWSDWIHVVHLRSLVYTDHFGLKLLVSPLYMPLGWCITVVQFGYLSLRLLERSRMIAIAIPTVLGMLFPPWYEQFAAPAGAWYYPPNGIMLWNTPLWVISTYGGCMFGVASAAIFLFKPHVWSAAIYAGIFASASFMFWSVVCFALFG